jgi:hypothetical protein
MCVVFQHKNRLPAKVLHPLFMAVSLAKHPCGMPPRTAADAGGQDVDYIDQRRLSSGISQGGRERMHDFVSTFFLIIHTGKTWITTCAQDPDLTGGQI